MSNLFNNIPEEQFEAMRAAAEKEAEAIMEARNAAMRAANEIKKAEADAKAKLEIERINAEARKAEAELKLKQMEAEEKAKMDIKRKRKAQEADEAKRKREAQEAEKKKEKREYYFIVFAIIVGIISMIWLCVQIWDTLSFYDFEWLLILICVLFGSGVYIGLSGLLIGDHNTKKWKICLSVFVGISVILYFTTSSLFQSLFSGLFCSGMFALTISNFSIFRGRISMRSSYSGIKHLFDD